mgnify:CR=1 FL=1
MQWLSPHAAELGHVVLVYGAIWPYDPEVSCEVQMVLAVWMSWVASICFTTQEQVLSMSPGAGVLPAFWKSDCIAAEQRCMTI